VWTAAAVVLEGRKKEALEKGDARLFLHHHDDDDGGKGENHQLIFT